MKTARFILLFFLAFTLSLNAFSQDVTLDKWKAAKELFQKKLTEANITDVEQPKWYENFYTTLGRMPLVDEVMTKPFSAPEIAVYFDDLCRKSGDSLSDLLSTADKMCNAVELPGDEETAAQIFHSMLKEKRIDASTLGIIEKINADKNIPESIRKAAFELVMATASADVLRKEAFAKLTPEEYQRLAYLPPHYFFPKKIPGEILPRSVVAGSDENTFFRAFTFPEIDDCVGLIFLVQKVDMLALHRAAEIMAKASDTAREIVKAAQAELAAAKNNDEILFQADAPFGKVIIAGGADNIHKTDCAVLIDIGGNDKYLNNAGGTSPAGLGVAVSFDISGDDTYAGLDFVQGTGYCGVGMLVDLAGNDTYTARNYSQCAALVGFSFLYEGGGDDSYIGDFGLQSFAIFGYSILSERGGNDTYRCNSFGQSGSSTLGVAVLAEASGDDVYISGGKYGFYGATDSSVTQGASSGIRPWPPGSKITVYGGVSMLSEAAGNDRYCAYAFAQGGAYIFALGMAVDSSGDDIYTGSDYTQGSGCHLAAGVLVDRAGDDYYTSRNHSTGFSLDCSVGVGIDGGGNDIYRKNCAGVGSAGKPRGIGIFVECGGDDIYSGTETTGYARSTYGENIHSIALFVDMKGKDKYAMEKAKDNSKWQIDDFGYGEDFEKEMPVSESAVWQPGKVKFASDEKIFSFSTYERLSGFGKLWHAEPEERFAKLCKAGESANRFACMDIVDAIEIMRMRKQLNLAQTKEVAALAKSQERNLRLMASRLGWLAGFKSEELTAVFAKAALLDESEAVRSMSLMALATSGDIAAIPSVKEAYGDESWVVRRRAAIALGPLGRISPDCFDILTQMLKDDDYRVRTQAARSLGIINNPEAVPALKAALKDKSAFVRLNVVRSLLFAYHEQAAMPALIDLLKWDNAIMIGEGVVPALHSISGQGYGADHKKWTEWWNTAKKKFDVKKYVTAGLKLDQIAPLDVQGRLPEAIPSLREIINDIPGHARASGLLAKALNQLAWQNAVNGIELEQSLKMAEEAVSLDGQAGHLDTLAVLKYLNNDKAGAREIILRAIKEAKAGEKHFYEDRLKQIDAGKLVM